MRSYQSACGHLNASFIYPLTCCRIFVAVLSHRNRCLRLRCTYNGKLSSTRTTGTKEEPRKARGRTQRCTRSVLWQAWDFEATQLPSPFTPLRVRLPIHPPTPIPPRSHHEQTCHSTYSGLCPLTTRLPVLHPFPPSLNSRSKHCPNFLEQHRLWCSDPTTRLPCGSKAGRGPSGRLCLQAYRAKASCA